MRLRFLVLLFIAATVSAASSQTLEMRGMIDGSQQELTLAELEALGTTIISTSGPWMDGVVQFEGVLLSRILDKVGAYGETLAVVALNDYAIDIPVTDVGLGPILAMKQDGNYMDVSDKGPFFIVYPYDANSDLQSDIYYARSVWQVSLIEVR